MNVASLFDDATLARDRSALQERWRAEGLHDDTTLANALAEAVRVDPANTIVMHSSERPGRIRLDELDEQSSRVARALGSRGIGHGDVVAIQLPNWVETVVLYLALTKLGAVFVPIVHIYGPKETDWILTASGARMFFCPDRWGNVDFSERIEQMPACASLEVCMVGEQVPEGNLSWEQLLYAEDPKCVLPTVSASDPLLMVYTSGTTSEPKGVIHTHQSLMAELRNMPQMPMGNPGAVSLQPWPAGHIGGLCAILSPLVTGTRCILLDKWNAEDAASLIAEHRVTMFCGAPIHVSAILEMKERGDERVDSVQEVLSGGAGVPPELVERCEAAGWLTMRCYGSSEHPTATAGSRSGQASERARTDGAPCPASELMIARPDGTEAKTGEAGEVWLRGPEQFLGYSDPRKNAEAFAEGGWFKTGDVGFLDRDGNLTITDRIKDIIIRGGENLSSLEIEDLVLRHGSVAEAAAVGMPDPRYGERVCVFVVPAAGQEPPDVPALLVHFKRLGVAKQKTPEKIVVVDSLPRTPAGKIKKHELRRQLV